MLSGKLTPPLLVYDRILEEIEVMVPKQGRQCTIMRVKEA